MKERVVAEVSIIPVGTSDTGLSHYIASCLEVLEGNKDLTYRLMPMGTVIEGSLDKILEAVSKMHEVTFSKGASRVVLLATRWNSTVRRKSAQEIPGHLPSQF